MGIPFEGRLTAADWSGANSLHYRPSGLGSALRILAVILLLLSYGLIVWAGLFNPATFLVFLFLLFVFSLPFWVGLVARLNYARNPLIRQPLSGTIAEDRIVVSTPNATTQFKWASFQRVKSGKGIVLLYVDKTHFNCFPRHNFRTEADWQAFNQLVDKQVHH